MNDTGAQRNILAPDCQGGRTMKGPRIVGLATFALVVSGDVETNPDFPPSRAFYKFLKSQSQELRSSQESQPVCTKHVHGFGEVSRVAGSLELRFNHHRRTAQSPFLPAPSSRFGSGPHSPAARQDDVPPPWTFPPYCLRRFDDEIAL